MTLRRSWLPFAGLSLLGVAAVLIAGAGGLSTRTFALGSPNQVQVALLDPGRRVCEGPITSSGDVAAVRIWGAAVGAPATVAVAVADASTRTVLARGRVDLTPTPDAYTAQLRGTAPRGRPLSVCVTGHGPPPVELLGSAPVRPGVLMTMAGKTLQAEFSLVLLGNSRQSLLTALPTAFSRAALYRPSWVGQWTFWLLAFALLATFGLGARAIGAAARADAGPNGPSATN